MFSSGKAGLKIRARISREVGERSTRELLPGGFGAGG